MSSGFSFYSFNISNLNLNLKIQIGLNGFEIVCKITLLHLGGKGRAFITFSTISVIQKEVSIYLLFHPLYFGVLDFIIFQLFKLSCYHLSKYIVSFRGQDCLVLCVCLSVYCFSYREPSVSTHRLHDLWRSLN